MKDTLAGLNPEQIRAVKAIQGPVLVLAGAGSGKTKALTHRIAYLHQHHKVPLSEILAITFTNKAAGEMKERVKRLLGLKSDKALWVSTFHSFCARLLRSEAGQLGYARDFSILDSDDQLTAIKKAIQRLELDPKKIHPEAVRAQISSAKSELVGSGEYNKLARGNFQQTVARIYTAYQAVLRQNQAMDFDDLLMLTVELWRTYPNILVKYQQRFKYLLVDEYQDTNTAQYELVQMLSAKHRNLFVVGDDWQSIYSWRGANYRNILNFHRDYPDAKIIKLEQNYRSTQNILDAAHAVIVQNRDRSEKKLWTNQAAGELIVIFEAGNDRAEGEFILTEIERLRVTEGAALNDIVILYRTNAQSRGIEETLIRASLPYRVVGGVRFYERKEIKDILAYLMLLMNPDNILALERVINVPVRGIGKRTWDELVREATERQISPGTYILENKILPEPIKEFAAIIKRLVKHAKTAPLGRLLDMIIAETGYKRMLTEAGIEGQTRLENIYELKSVMEKYDSLDTRTAIQTFLEEVALIADVDNYQPEEAAVTLMTVHAAKGLEFDYVFMAGMEENIFPYSRSLFDAAELEEERRLCYVAITRARKRVYLIHSQERLLYGTPQLNPPSRFIADIPPELTETVTANRRQPTIKLYQQGGLQPGAKVEHQHFGQGVVIGRTADIVTVAFIKAGVKKLAAELAKLKIK